MMYYSTNKEAPPVSFREAVMQGLAPDGGLYMPTAFPHFDLEATVGLAFQELSYQLAVSWIGDEVPHEVLRIMIDEALNFGVPLVKVQDGIHSLELFHGPTLAFKDFGARFMARLLAYFNAGQPELTILVATSGDTGSAVANGFFGVPGIQVVVLYPSGRISEIQEKQMATLGSNVHALEIRGSFDDCQRLVKEAFQDSQLRNARRLTSANSINIARLLPQSFYYFYAYSLLGNAPVVISVPSGNFGNLTAGIFAKRAGLPIKRFVAATNRNDVVPEYLQTGKFRPRPSLETISNAMDVGNPSNFARIQELYGGDAGKLREDVEAHAFTDEETREAMRETYQRFGYVLDPHGAVAYLGAVASKSSASEVVFLETAHPAKFRDVVEPVLGISIELPETLKACLSKPKLSIPMSSEYAEFKSWLLGRV